MLHNPVGGVIRSATVLVREGLSVRRTLTMQEYDLYNADYDEMKKDEILPNFYKCMYECLSIYNDYSVVGHFNVIDRYIPFEPDYYKVSDIIEAILKIVIQQGKGIEFKLPVIDTEWEIIQHLQRIYSSYTVTWGVKL